jgi:hypothetical protein
LIHYWLVSLAQHRSVVDQCNDAKVAKITRLAPLLPVLEGLSTPNREGDQSCAERRVLSRRGRDPWDGDHRCWER